METKDIFGKRLFEIRKEHGETQQELADDLGITRQSLSFYEQGERTANIDFIRKVAEHYNVSADYLLGLSEIKSNNADLISVCQYTGLNEEAVSMLRQFNAKEHKDLMGVVNRLISEGVLTDMARILSAKEQVKYLKYDFMDFMVNLANKFVRR